ncbi:uncharacterized protein LOC114128203 isoform X2 [Aphis gossypii]|uniref:uncharacterized protein LOC114128203 isoform X2 n=1 Tax=Aphis gossypii TaxID=80765 RepID=UPI002159A673|nr:uncharacterized protein LOC114128203 isoform X2 [Aphis gossypii]
MSETKNWRKGAKSKCFPSKSRKHKGNIAALRQSKARLSQKNEDEYNMTLNNIANTSETINEPIEPMTIDNSSIKSDDKKKFLEQSPPEVFGKVYSVLSKNEDDLDVFGKFVTSELRGLIHENLRRKAKRQIQQIILDIAEEDAKY